MNRYCCVSDVISFRAYTLFDTKKKLYHLLRAQWELFLRNQLPGISSTLLYILYQSSLDYVVTHCKVCKVMNRAIEVAFS